MKHLWLIRHATAVSGDHLLPDFERKLDPLGRQEAIQTGKAISKTGIFPLIVLSSAAHRTMETAGLVCSELGYPVEIQAVQSLYNANFQTLLIRIRETEDKIDSLAVVGHNPGISQLASVLAENESFQLAPSAAVCLSFPVANWPSVAPGKGKTHYYHPLQF